MGWDKDGKYYTRSRRENGQVVREYIGCGRVALLAAQLDTLDREKRMAKSAAVRAERNEVAALDEPLTELIDLTDLLVRAALLAAGYHQHHRGNWRKRRARPDETE